MIADNYGIHQNNQHVGGIYCIVTPPSLIENRVAVHYRGIWFKQRYMRLL